MPPRPRPHRTRAPHPSPAPLSPSTLSTPSLAQPALSLEPDPPRDAPLAPSTALGAAHRSPSALSLRSDRTLDSARGGGRRPSSTAPRAPSSLGRPDTPSTRGGDGDEPPSDADDDEAALSRASSSSSLDGLAARLQGARAGKGKGTVREGTAPPGASPSSSSSEGKARLVDPRAPPPPPPAHDASPSPSRAESPLPAAAAAASTSYDLPRLSPSPSPSPSTSTPLAPTARGSSPSPSPAPSSPSRADAAFARPPSPSTSALDPEEEDDEPDEPAPAPDPGHAARSGSRSAAHPDPRSLLRAQLARAPSSTRRAGASGAKPALSRAPSAGAGAEVRVRPVARRAALVRRRYFILSTAGKLVWTSDDDDEAATGLVGVMQAIVSIFADEGDKLRYIDAGETRVSFLLKAPLYLVVVSSLGEPESVLRVHLDYLYLQVLSVVTQAQLQAIFAKRSNFDLRRLMEGTEPFFASLTSTLQTSLPILLSSIEVYRLAPTLRDELARALDPGKDAVRQLDLLYVVLLCRGRLVTLLRPKKHSIHPTDLHLVLSTIYAPRPAPAPPPPPPPADNDVDADADSDKAPPRPPAARPTSSAAPRPSPLTAPDAETWLPICLPRFNARGFLHAYVSFFGPSSSSGGAGAAETGLVVVSSQRDAFAGVREVAGAIRARLGVGAPAAGAGAGAGAAGEALHALEMAAARQAYSLGELAVPGLRHFVYKDRGLVQVTAPRWEGEYAAGEGEGGEEAGEEEAERARMRLTTLYQHVHDALHPRPAAAGTAARPPAQVQYLRTEHEAVLGWVTPQFELYLATAPRLPHSAVVSAARAVARWVKREERGLFLHGAGTF